ncbi:hypothetical protein [Haloarcula marina]|uniref:hypothetical protein n=1 Tax=Haloarcula marina TaxID=2961574 RepID=UPI0020B6B4F9|nr:hypothetical protein [Halomicroarcula marina]
MILLTGYPKVTDEFERTLDRPSPVERSPSGLVSRDYRPLTRGPDLIASWPLGPAPRQSEPGDVDWQIASEEYVTIQKNRLTLPYAGDVERAPLYLNVRGRVRVTPGATLTVHLRTTHLREGKPYDVRITLSNDEADDFQTPFVEFAPERPGDYADLGEVYAGYELEAKVTDGNGYLDQGTSVALYSE